ncbi:Acyl transferase domain-containing protein [Desulfovibrio desulfuricans]|uniref:Acyl transferase domain-containing protein n=2 Tax=Desulfovibrionaceae TaxID=194924 RepID=A0AA94HUA5_DESDE|nr:Acyl transferase domain-containing protein [Desulfovibrio desulfuricans]SPD36490.1 Polyketide synthase PKS, Type I [Desulfovibrio sp. G11]
MSMMDRPQSPVAIVGMGFRFPGNIYDALGMWNMLSHGRCCITKIPANRWPVNELEHSNRSEPGRSVTFAAGVLSDIDKFDAAFFGISPREAAWLDPQQRLLLEMAYEAMEDSGIRPSSLAGSSCGVYIGISGLDYGQHALEDMASMSAYVMTGNTLSVAANRLSYFFDLHGPSMSVDTACSSSLVALHHACQAVSGGEVPMALAGGVGLLMHPYSFVGFSKANMLSARGHCRPFDASADGYVRAEGGAVLLLKPLHKALEDGDPIHATIVASGVNADGGRKSGLTIPSVAAQAELMRHVLLKSQLRPEDVDFIEAHGTGTPAGDPVEVASIGQAYGDGRGRPVPISSVKANVGHLEPASGMAGLVKAVLALKNKFLPPMSLDFTPNPAIDFKEANVECAACGISLLRKDEKPLTAGVNSFGFGGVNAHVILQAAPLRAASPAKLAATLPPLLLSARSEDALCAMAANYADHIERAGLPGYYDIAYGAAFHRDRMEKRLALFRENFDEIVPALRSWAAGDRSAHILREDTIGKEGGIVFVYTGNGAQWHGMGRTLYIESADFAAIMSSLDKDMRPLLGFSLLDVLQGEDPEILQDTTVSQPLLFSIQVGVTNLLRKWGIAPQAAMGHSVGEITAAWATGALSLQQAIQVICARSHAQGKTRGSGRMAAVGMSAGAAHELIQEMGLAAEVEIAGINSPNNITLSGKLDALLQIQAHLQLENTFFHLLELDYAFHSRSMDSIKDVLAQKLEGFCPSPTSAVLASTVTGRKIEGSALGSEYWWNNVRQAVRFSDAVQELASLGFRIFVEVGPHAILQRYLRETLSASGIKGRIFSTLLRGDDGKERIARLAMRLHLFSDETNLRAFFPYEGERVRLPLYPWQKTRCWFPRTSECALDKRRTHPLLGWPLEGVDLIWENILDPDKDIWLADHNVGGAVVFPGAGYVEMALACAHAWSGNEHVVLESLDIAIPLVFEGGNAQCVRCSLHTADGTFRIVSRPRLGTGDWVQHASGRILSATGRTPDLDMRALPQGCQEMNGAALYALAEALGLEYGPAFQVVQNVRAHNDRFDVDLIPVAADAQDYLLHPVVLDACFHSLVSLQAHDDASLQVAYLPVKMGRFDRCAPGVVTRIKARVHHWGRRSLGADFELWDEAAGRLVACVSDCRFRSMPLSHAMRQSVEEWSILPWLHPLACEEKVRTTPSLDSLMALLAPTSDAFEASRESWFKHVLPLMEAMTLAFAWQAFRSLAADDPHWAQKISGAYAQWLMCLLRDEGLLEQRNGEWLLASESGIPPVESLWQDALRHDSRSLPSLLALGRTGLHLENVLSGQMDGGALREEIYTASVARAFNHADPANLGMERALNAVVQHLAETWSGPTRLRILEIGAAPGNLTKLLDAKLPEDRFEHVLALCNSEATHQARARYEKHPSVTVVSCDAVQLSFDDEKIFQRSFDVIVLRHALHKADNLRGALSKIRGLLSSNGLLLAVERHPDWSTDFLEGLDSAWWQVNPAEPENPLSSLLVPEAWQQAFEEHGFSSCRIYKESAAEGLAEGAYLLLAAGPDEQCEIVDIPEKKEWLLLGDAASEHLAESLCARLQAKGQQVVCTCHENPQAVGNADHVVFLRGGHATPQEVTPTLDDLLYYVRQCVEHDAAPRLWIVTRGGALDSGLPEGCEVRPAQCALWGLGRVVASEYDQLHCTLVDAPYLLNDEDAARLLEQEFLYSDDTDEVLLTPRGRYALRLKKGGAAAAASITPMDRCRLDFMRPGKLGNLTWYADNKRVLAPDEVEARVMATGLNFRDVMLTMGLLPDEAVENGFAGPSLGLEFAGVVTRVGHAVEDLQPGDTVVGFAPACFASHVVTPKHAVVRIPETWNYEAAATIPTVFFTAWYALNYLARLQPHETVLIHGAAGGVGIAAIQIAHHLGAKVFATAGSEEKRDFLRLMGVEHVFDSRSLSFADDVLAATGGAGVDVALNSLAGEAMRRSLGVLKPFGRFLELGKRDFVENTSLGLRPFKENISYFAIDADQLLTARPALAAKLFQEVMRLLEEEVLAPLPYRIFPATDVVAAFRTMQQAQHIGKIVVSLADLPPVPHVGESPATLDLSGAGTWLVTGGLSGFGLATADHLAKRGVRHLVLVGRRGATTPEAVQALESLADQGVNARAEACDVSDAAAVRALVERVAATMPPLTGVVHAAAVFDDRFLAQMDKQSLDAVLSPKLYGAWHLHEATLGLSLTHFVLYSSISTALGNPGQGNYVAANAGLEGLARLRVSMGLPAACIAWGPVGDVGYLTRNDAVKKTLAQRLGKAPMSSSEAMEQFDAALAAGGLHILANVDWGAVLGMFPRAASRFDLIGRHAVSQRGPETSLDIHQLLDGKSPEQVLEIIRGLIAEEVAQVLALGVGQVAMDRSLQSMGLDSLMAVELAISLEQRVGVRLPAMMFQDSPTVEQVAERIVARLNGAASDEDSQATLALSEMARRHAEDISESELRNMVGHVAPEGEKA